MFIGGGMIDGKSVSSTGERFQDECLKLRHHSRGLLSMRSDGDNSNGSAFMVTLGNTNTLDGYNNVIGELVSGHETLN